MWPQLPSKPVGFVSAFVTVGPVFLAFLTFWAVAKFFRTAFVFDNLRILKKRLASTIDSLNF
jgi:hypothetical protein